MNSSAALVSSLSSKWNWRMCTLVRDFCTGSSKLKEIAMTGQLDTQEPKRSGARVQHSSGDSTAVVTARQR